MSSDSGDIAGHTPGVADRFGRAGSFPALGAWLLCLLLAGMVVPPADAQLAFSASFDASVRAESATGRLLVYLAPGGPTARDPTEDVLFGPANPIYGIEVKALRPGEVALVDDSADGFPCKISQLPDGHYVARAVLDMFRLSGDWRMEKGNLSSAVIHFTKAPGTGAVEIRLSQVVDPGPDPAIDGVELFSMRSRLLSEFHGRDVVMRAVVSFPRDYDSRRRYPVLYQVGGFGQTYRDGFSRDRLRRRSRDLAELQRQTFEVYLDADSPNGHTLFCDSDVNGPWGGALTQELIPALEARYPFIARPEARLLRGHSSGGWAVIWLATEYPDVFGAAWASSPDPVDFHCFQRVNAYEDASFFFVGASTQPVLSYIRRGRAITTIREESLIEHVIGPNRTGGQQWHAWQSCWGRRGPDGNARALFDPLTGVIDRKEAESYRRFDIVDRLRRDPQRFGPIFRQRIRVVVGDQDNWDLDKAVARLAAALEQLLPADTGGEGYVRIVPGFDHFSIFRSRELRGFPGEMLAHLRKHALAVPAPRPGAAATTRSGAAAMTTRSGAAEPSH